jgi:hypothetical protein
MGREQEVIRLKITDQKHVELCIYCSAHLEAAALVEKALKEYKLPGLGMAHALLETEAQEMRSQMISKNYKFAARNGIDFSTHSIQTLERDRDGSFVLVLAPMDLIDQADRDI